MNLGTPRLECRLTSGVISLKGYVTAILILHLTRLALFAQIAPQISSQPADRTALLGATVAFSVGVTGTSPLRFQWVFNSVEVPNATNVSLTLASVHSSNAGTFSVIVTNNYGSATSAVARLTVLSNPPPTVVGGWGLNDAGQIATPSNFFGAVSVYAGLQHALALRSDGAVTAWGNNAFGQLNVPGVLTNAMALAAGAQHSLGIRSNGSVVAWGDNSAGQSAVPQGLSNSVAVAAGGFHSLALRSGGIIVGWGDNRYGQAAAQTGLSNVMAVAAGGYFSAALATDGRVTAWGYNRNGQTSVPSNLTNAVAIAAGFNHLVALRSDGTVAAWGYNGSGQTSVPPDLSKVVAIAAGFNHSLALQADGSVVCWGNNANGQATTPSGLTNFIAIAAGGSFNVAITPAPFVRTPPANQLLILNSNATFTVGVVSAIPVNYQWLSNGINISGATESSFTLSNAQPSDAGSYAVLVSNSYGAIQSPPAVLASAPLILSPPTNQIGQIGRNISFPVTATNFVTATYKWQFKGADIAGATSATFVRSNAQFAHVGDYRSVVSSIVGSVTSAPAWLSLVSSNRVAKVGDNVSLSITSALPYALQWQINGTNLVGQTASDIGLTNIQAAQSGNYRVLADEGHGPMVSPDIAVTVFTLPAITNPPVSQIVVRGSNATFMAGEAGTGPLAYQWLFNNTKISAATNSILTITNAQSTNVGNYSVIVSNYAGAVTGAVAMLTVVFPPTSLTVPAGVDAIFTLTSSVPATLSYQWKFNGESLPNATNATLVFTNVQDTNSGSLVVVVTNSFGATASATANLVVTSSPPWFLVQPLTRVVWNGSSASFNATPRGSEPLVLQWRKDGVALPGATNATLVLSNLAVADGGRYSLSASNAFGVGISSNATLRVIPVASPGSVVTWGGFFGMSGYVPADICGAVAISGATSHSLALLSDGTVRVWGANDFGQLQMPPGLSNVVAIDGGNFHSIVLRKDGSVVAWANNGSGQSTIPAGLKPSISVSAGGDHNVVLQEDGAVAAWGNDYSGESTVPAGLSNVVDVAAGSAFSLALKADGTVAAWGRNDYGQISLPPDLTNVVAIAAGYQQALALKQDGTVVAWGDIAAVPVGLTGVVAIAAGGFYAGGNQAFALKADGTLVGWGNADYGALTFPPGLSNLTAVASGATHVLVLKPGLATSDITVPPASVTTNAGANVTFSVSVSATPLSYRWQFNGTNLPGATNSFLALTNVQSTSAGNYAVVVTSCAGAITNAPATLTVISTAPVISSPIQRKSRHPGEQVNFRVAALGTEPFTYQWLLGGTPIPGATNAAITLADLQPSNGVPYQVVVSNSVGMASATYALTILPPYSLGSVIEWGSLLNVPPGGISGIGEIAAGDNFSLALRTNGTLTAWGDNSFGQTNIPAGLSNVIHLAGGGRHALALRADGTLVGWGHNYNGQATPPPGLEDIEVIASGDSFNVAAKADGSVVAWGNGYGGVLSIPSQATNIAQLAAGNGHVLALRNDGTIIGWGDDTYGQVSGPSAESNAVAISAGHVNSVVIKADGSLKAFGINFAGQADAPTDLTNAVAIATAYGRSYAVTSNGNVVGWGENDWGQITPPPTATNITAVAAGNGHTLALKNTGVFITKQPQGATVLAGTNVTFGVEAVGVSPLTYQWKLNGTNIAGAAAGNLTLTNVQDVDAGDYTVSLTTVVGENLSAAARLTVLSPPRFLDQPQSQAILAGSNITFWTRTAGTAPLRYQWFSNSLALSGKTATNLTLTNVISPATNAYQVRVTNSYGSITSAAALLTVYFPPTVQTQPTNQTIVMTSNATFLVSASGTSPLAYRWLFNNADILEATNASLTLANIQPAEAGSYRAVVTNSFGSVTSATAVLTVAALAPTIVFPPINRTVYVGSNVSFSVIAVGVAPLGYQWRYNGSSLPDTTNASLVVPNSQSVNAGVYDVIVTNNYGAATSSPALLQVLPHPNVVAWGLNDKGQTNVPPHLTNVVAVASDFSHSLALRADGTVAAWGANDSGQLNVPPGLSNVLAIAAGNDHSLALRSDGTVVGWGGNTYGQAVPPAGLGNVIAIAAGSTHSLALRSDGTVVGWGYNIYGQASPPADLTNAVAVAAGYEHSIALRSDGTIAAWGYFYGDPTSISNVVAISGKSFHFLLLRNNRTILGWGSKTVEGPTNVMAVSAGGNSISLQPHNLAILTNGNVAAWGANTYGQASPPSGLSNIIGIAAGYYFSVAVRGGPEFMTHPSGRTVLEGESVELVAEVYSFLPTTFQWQRNGTNVSGATSTTLSVPSVQFAHRGDYTLVASNRLGVARSGVATLTVIPLVPQITSAFTNQTVVIGSNAVFAVGVSGLAPLAYQWRFNGVNIPGATANSLAVLNAATIHAGAYSVVVANANGNAESGPAALTVVPADVIVDNPQAVLASAWSVSVSGTEKFGADCRFKSQGTGSGTASFIPILPFTGRYEVYEWHPQSSARSAGAPHFVDYNGGTQIVFVDQRTNGGKWNLLGAFPFTAGATGSVRITDAFPDVGQSVTADAIRFVYLSPPVILSQPQSQFVMAGGTARFNVSAASTSPLTFQWQNGVTDLTAATLSQLSLANVQPAQAGWYRVLVSNEGGTTASTAATLNVGVPLQIGSLLDSVSLTWSGPFMLQTATNAAGPFYDLAGVTSPFALPVNDEPERYFRLRLSVEPALSLLSLEPGGALQVSVPSVAGFRFSVQASTNLLIWTPVFVGTAPFMFTDLEATNFPARFYRVFWTP